MTGDTFGDLLSKTTVLSDVDYHGGLSATDDALASELAAATGISPGEQCGEPDPRAGVFVGNTGDKPKSVDMSDPALYPHLRDLGIAATLGATRHQRDVAARALSKLGQATKPLLGALDARADASPWLREVDSAATCQRFSAVAPQKVLVSESECGVHGCAALQNCAAYRILLRHMNESVRAWPANVLSDYASNFGCGHDDSLPPVVAGILENPKQLPELRLDVLSMVGSISGKSLSDAARHQWLVAIERPLLELLQSNDERLRWESESLLISLRARSAPNLLAKRITDAHWITWDAEACSYPHAAALLVPALLQRLQNEHDWIGRANAAKDLRCFDETYDVGVLVRSLRLPDYVLQEEAIRTLSRRRPLAIEAGAELQYLARTHWAPRLRRLAHEALSGSIADVKEDSTKICFGMCQPDMEQHACHGDAFGDGEFHLDNESEFPVSWHLIVDKRKPITLPADLAGDSSCDANELIQANGRLVSLTCLEYTGGLYSVGSDNKAVLLFGQGTRGAFRVNAHIIAIGAAFLFAPSNAIVMAIDPGAAEKDRMRPLSAWPGALPDRYAYSPSGKLLLTNGSVALAVDEAGRLSELRCPRSQ